MIERNANREFEPEHSQSGGAAFTRSAAGLVPVHFFGEDFAVGSGWVNVAQIVAVRPVAVDLSPLCPDCRRKAVQADLVPPALAVRTVLADTKYRLLGDGLHDETQAVQQARKLHRLLLRCQRAQHSPSGPVRGVASLPARRRQPSPAQ